MLNEEEQTRYDRQMLLPNWGISGQQKVKSATVFIAGAGGLGSSVSIYLAAAGVGTLVLCDSDQVDLSNLNRQILHQTSNIGHSKVNSAEKTLRDLNPMIQLKSYAEYLNENNIEQIVGNPDLILDCLDNFETRYLLNQYGTQKSVPMIHGAVHGLMGQATFLSPPETPCLLCIFPTAPPKEIFPVVGAVPGLIGCIQALEALKYLTGIGTTLTNQLLLVDGEDMSFTPVKVRRNPNCPMCASLQN